MGRRRWLIVKTVIKLFLCPVEEAKYPVQPRGSVPGPPQPCLPSPDRKANLEGVLGSQAPLWAGVRLPSCKGVWEP